MATTQGKTTLFPLFPFGNSVGKVLWTFVFLKCVSMTVGPEGSVTLTGLVGVVGGLLLHHHVGRGEPVRVGVGAPVPGGARGVSRPLVQRVQVLLLEALLQVGHAGVRVLAVVAPTSSTSSSSTATTTTWTPTPSHATAAMPGWGGGHALKGLCWWWWELGAHGLPRRALVPGTDQSQRRRHSQARPQERRRQPGPDWTRLSHLALMGKLLLGNGCEAAAGFM